MGGTGWRGRVHLLVHQVVDGVGLVTVGHDGLVAEHANGIVNDQMGINHLRLVKGLGAHRVTLNLEHAVAAVDASAHDKVGGDRLFAVGALADHNASAVVGKRVQFVNNG